MVDSNKDNAINSKRTSKSKKKSTKPDFKMFIKKFATRVFTFIISLFLGAVVLYSCRGAQTNLLPTCLNEQPFTDIPADIASIDVDFNVFGYADNIKSTKINFPVEENSNLIDKGLFFKSLKDMVDVKNPSSSPFTLFFATIFQKSIASHFSVSSSIFKAINNFLSDTFIVLLGHTLYIFSVILPFIYDFFYFMIAWFSNLSLLTNYKDEMKINLNSGKKGPPDIKTHLIWKKGSSTFWSITYFILSIILFLIGIIPALALLVGILFLLIYSLVPYASHLKSYYASDPTKSFGILATFKDIFINKTYIFMYAVSCFLIVDAHSYLSSYSAILAFIACLILYFFTSLYDTDSPAASEHVTTGLAGYEVPSRHCKPPPFVKKPTIVDRIKIGLHEVKEDAKEAVKVVPDVIDDAVGTITDVGSDVIDVVEDVGSDVLKVVEAPVKGAVAIGEDVGKKAIKIIEAPIEGLIDVAEKPITLAKEGVTKFTKKFATLGKSGIKGAEKTIEDIGSGLEKSSELAAESKVEQTLAQSKNK